MLSKIMLKARNLFRYALILGVVLQFVIIVFLVGSLQSKVHPEAAVVSLIQQQAPTAPTIHEYKDYTLPQKWSMYKPLKNLVSAFEAGKIDWHHLVPGIQKPDVPDALKFERLIKKEKMVVDTLLDARDIPKVGLTGDPSYNPDFQYCTRLNDHCVIHRDQTECESDGFCSWCGSINLCTERYTALKPDGLGKGKYHSLCPEHVVKKEHTVPQPISRPGITISNMLILRVKEGKIVFENYGGQMKIPPRTSYIIENKHMSASEALSQCKNIIYGTTIFGKMQWEGMYWHFIKSHLTQLVRELGKSNSGDIHFVLSEDTDPVNFKWFSMVTKNCIRTIKEIPDGTCFADARFQNLFIPNESFNQFSNYVLDKFGLLDYPLPEEASKQKPILGIISRHNKRIILNEPALIQAGQEMGFDVKILIYDRMSIEEQISRTRECDVLLGVHGSGLLNQIYMRPGKILVQVTPFGLPGLAIESAYGSLATSTRLHYLQLEIKDNKNGVLHWHFMEDIFSDHYDDDIDDDRPKNNHSYGKVSKSKILQVGSKAMTDITMARVLMVQQDVIIPVDQFKETLTQALDQLNNPSKYNVNSYSLGRLFSAKLFKK